MQRVMIIGATSAIAEATARVYAKRGDALALLARNQERLQSMAEDLKIRGANKVLTRVIDVNDTENHTTSLDGTIAELDGVDVVLIAHGTLPDQRACEADISLTLNEFATNATSTIALLTHLANHFEQQGKGQIAVISSVAGDRGRQSNYVYGAAKGALTIFLQGLRNRLAPKGVQVLTIKPGFVDTPMTAEFKKGLLWAQPEQIAKGIVKGIDKRKDVVYLPFFWRYIMIIIRSIPERIFKKLKL
ncbi:MAG: SDR family oxidoreductase [Gammaproteobacteria bacterium]|nr:SDR family oxidoreductase [Gammaproteobacteria bacterium]